MPLFFFLELTYDDGSRNLYQFPLAVTVGTDAESIHASDPDNIIAQVSTVQGLAILHEAVLRDDVRHAFLNMVEINGETRSHAGWLRGRRGNASADLGGEQMLVSRVASVEQSNTSLIYGDRFIMKLFRRLEPGENPDTEVSRFLTETAHFSRIPKFLGDVTVY